MPSEDVKRRLAAIMSADAKDYSRLMREDEAWTVRTLMAYQEIMNGLIQQHHGRVVDSPGDNLLAEFASVVDAVQGAVAIQKELGARNAELPDQKRMDFRIGINLGDVIVDEDRIYGDGVNIAARLEALADPGGICISRTAYDQIEDKLPLGYEYMGERRVKNIPRPVQAYKVLLDRQATRREQGSREEPVRWPGHRPFAGQRIDRRWRRKDRSRASFTVHLRTYVGVIGLLLVIDLVTGGGWWFYWPALGWGFFLFLHWNYRHAPASFRSRDTDQERPSDDPGRHRPGGTLKHLYIKVEPRGGAPMSKDRVDIRVPIKLLKAGVKLSSALPDRARDRINRALREKGIDFDLSALDGAGLDEVIDSLMEDGIRIESEDKEIHIYCE